MDHRCPICRADFGRRKYAQSVIARMEVDCSHCGATLRLNVHRAEVVVLYVSVATIVGLATLAYALQSQALALATLGAMLLGALALPVLERLVLRRWPRYAPAGKTDPSA